MSDSLAVELIKEVQAISVQLWWIRIGIGALLGAAFALFMFRTR